MVVIGINEIIHFVLWDFVTHMILCNVVFYMNIDLWFPWFILENCILLTTCIIKSTNENLICHAYTDLPLNLKWFIWRFAMVHCYANIVDYPFLKGSIRPSITSPRPEGFIIQKHRDPSSHRGKPNECQMQSLSTMFHQKEKPSTLWCFIYDFSAKVWPIYVVHPKQVTSTSEGGPK